MCVLYGCPLCVSSTAHICPSAPSALFMCMCMCMCVQYSNKPRFKRKHSFKREQVFHVVFPVGVHTPTPIVGVIFKIISFLSRIEDRTCVQSVMCVLYVCPQSDPSLAKPWRIWRGCWYKNFVSRICLSTSLLLQTPKETCARANIIFPRAEQPMPTIKYHKTDFWEISSQCVTLGVGGADEISQKSALHVQHDYTSDFLRNFTI